MTKNFLLTKEVNKSLLERGFTVPVTAQKIFDATKAKLAEHKSSRDDTLLKELDELARMNARLAVDLAQS